MECVKDCYSVNNELECTESEISGAIYKGVTSVQVGFTGNIDCEKPVARALGVFCAKASSVSAEAGDGSVQLSGMVTGNFVYIDADDKLGSAGFTLPFAVLAGVEGCTNDSEIIADAVITDAAVKRNGAGADVAGTVTVSVYVIENRKTKVVSGVLPGEEKPPVDWTVEAVIAEAGEDAWSVGKALNMTPDEITELNPELSKPLSEPQRIVVYRKL